MIAVIRIRSGITSTEDVRKTFRMLRLGTKLSCSVFPDTPSIRGMLKRVERYVTYGDIDDSVLQSLKKRRQLTKDTYALHPPIGGFEKKGVKLTYNNGGAAGNRGKDMAALLQRMM